jgi:hypothetical protein
MLEQERQRIEQLTAGWDDPTQVDWGPQDGEEPAALPPEHTGPVYKCIALYSYTVSRNIDDELIIATIITKDPFPLVPSFLYFFFFECPVACRQCNLNECSHYTIFFLTTFSSERQVGTNLKLETKHTMGQSLAQV